MKRITVFTITAILTLILTSCVRNTNTNNKTSNKVQTEIKNPYLVKYSGGYTVEVKEVSSTNEIEAYALKDNGQAEWMWIKNDGKGGAKIVGQKSGTWESSETKITINIKGNSGSIIEVYELQHGVFVNTLIKDRYLKRNK